MKIEVLQYEYSNSGNTTFKMNKQRIEEIRLVRELEELQSEETWTALYPHIRSIHFMYDDIAQPSFLAESIAPLPVPTPKLIRVWFVYEPTDGPLKGGQFVGSLAVETYTVYEDKGTLWSYPYSPLVLRMYTENGRIAIGPGVSTASGAGSTLAHILCNICVQLSGPAVFNVLSESGGDEDELLAAISWDENVAKFGVGLKSIS